MIDLNKLAKETYETAVRRGKFVPTDSKSEMHNVSYSAILGELTEFAIASEMSESIHIKGYTEAEEEMIDILITCLTGLRQRGTDIEKLLLDKMEFNKARV